MKYCYLKLSYFNYYISIKCQGCWSDKQLFIKVSLSDPFWKQVGSIFNLFLHFHFSKSKLRMLFIFISILQLSFSLQWLYYWIQSRVWLYWTLLFLNPSSINRKGTGNKESLFDQYERDFSLGTSPISVTYLMLCPFTSTKLSGKVVGWQGQRDLRSFKFIFYFSFQVDCLKNQCIAFIVWR